MLYVPRNTIPALTRGEADNLLVQITKMPWRNVYIHVSLSCCFGNNIAINVLRWELLFLFRLQFFFSLCKDHTQILLFYVTYTCTCGTLLYTTLEQEYEQDMKRKSISVTHVFLFTYWLLDMNAINYHFCQIITHYWRLYWSEEYTVRYQLLRITSCTVFIFRFQKSYNIIVSANSAAEMTTDKEYYRHNRIEWVPKLWFGFPFKNTVMLSKILLNVTM